MTLQEIIDGNKRDAQTGEVGNNADLPASDILRQFNLASEEFWEFEDWPWSKTDISFTLAAGTSTPTTLAAAIGRIIVLGVQAQEGDLAVLSEREYRKRRNISPSQTGAVWAAVMRGLSATGAMQVLFVETPTEDTVIEGEGKTKISTYAVADIPTLGQIPYFPVEIQPILYDMTLARYLVSIKDARGGPLGNAVMARLRALAGRSKSQPADQVTTPPPEYVRFTRRRRGGRTVV